MNRSSYTNGRGFQGNQAYGSVESENQLQPGRQRVPNASRWWRGYSSMIGQDPAQMDAQRLNFHEVNEGAFRGGLLDMAENEVRSRAVAARGGGEEDDGAVMLGSGIRSAWEANKRGKEQGVGFRDRINMAIEGGVYGMAGRGDYFKPPQPGPMTGTASDVTPRVQNRDQYEGFSLPAYGDSLDDESFS